MPNVPVLKDKCAIINLIMAKLTFAIFYEAWYSMQSGLGEGPKDILLLVIRV